ncbi:MAG: fatty acid desaturase [Geminicoccaceae bacterium]
MLETCEGRAEGIAIPGAEERSPRYWATVLAPYREPKLGRSLAELVATALPFFLLWAAAWLSLSWSIGLSLLLSIPAALFLVRLFMIQHDCGHGSFFRRRPANDWLGRCIAVLTLTPYAEWRQAHNVHHASSGHLDKRGIGDIDTLTVAEFAALPRWRRVAYRISRHPAVMFGLAPAYLFLLKHRLPSRPTRSNREGWLSTMSANAVIAAVVTVMVLLLGWRDFLLVQVPVTLVASTIGVWLFYVQHQFEHTWWERGSGWSVHAGALHGSSHYDLPQPLRWLTANIGIHHVHHLSSRIPSYRLGEVLRDHPELRRIGRLTIAQSFGCLKLALWDENARRLVSFREAAGGMAAPA